MTLVRPDWEYGGTFNAAWDGTQQVIERIGGPDLTDRCLLILRAMSIAHVVTMDPQQFLALPPARDAGDLLEFVPDPHLPFPILYVSIAGLPPNSDSGMKLAGILLGGVSQAFGYEEYGGHVAAIPFWSWTGVPYSITIPSCTLDLTNHSYTMLLEDTMIREPNPSAKNPWGPEDSDIIAWADFDRAVRVVRFLESSNVDFEEQPVSRQVRRAASRRGTPIAKRVYVRSPRYRRTKSDVVEHIEFSHRFEVRGHYKHYGPDTRLFRATERDRPNKIIEHPDRGPMVRVWCPDFVKGPEDKPLVPKTRVYKKEGDA